MNRQGATAKGLQKRVRDLDFAQVTDPREVNKVKLALPTLLTALVAAMVTKARSLRAVEQRTAQMACKLGSWLGLNGRIADNTFGKVIPRLRFSQLVCCLHRLVKAECLTGPTLCATNLEKPDTVKIVPLQLAAGATITVELPPCSLTGLRFERIKQGS